jgi:hypothetical protein
MYSSVEAFLAAHFAAISDLMAEAATRAGGHYAEMSAEARRLNARHDTVELIQALTEGRIDRQAVQTHSARPTNTGLVADDLLRLTIIFQPWFEDYVAHELAEQPYLAEALRHRMQQVNISFRANLLSVKIDHAINHATPHPVDKDRR